MFCTQIIAAYRPHMHTPMIIQALRVQMPKATHLRSESFSERPKLFPNGTVIYCFFICRFLALNISTSREHLYIKTISSQSYVICLINPSMTKRKNKNVMNSVSSTKNLHNWSFMQATAHCHVCLMVHITTKTCVNS